MTNVRKLLGAIPLLLFVLSSVHAQVTTGNVRGVVTDPNGAVVTNAKVTLTKKSTNNLATTQTSETGQFEFNNLLLGNDTQLQLRRPALRL